MTDFIGKSVKASIPQSATVLGQCLYTPGTKHIV